MSDSKQGLTVFYNRVHDINDASREVEEMRALLAEMDHAVTAVYGWNDITLAHDFYQTNNGPRFTISDVARREALDRLVKLNHQRHAEELAAASARAADKPPKRSRKKRDGGDQTGMDFDME